MKSPCGIHDRYSLSLGNGFSWSLNAAVPIGGWLSKLARIMELGHATRPGAASVGFVRARGGRWRVSRFTHLISQLHADHTPRVGWGFEDFGLVRLWSHADMNDLICELAPVKDYPREVLQMWYSMHAMYRGLCLHGGLPLHCALIERNGKGVALIAGEGTGKSTCCRRLQPPWKALSDDLALVVPAGEGRYTAHPLPTWSDHIIGNRSHTWSVEQGIPVAGIFFLEQADRDEALAIGQGRAAVAVTKSASYVCTRDSGQKYAEQTRNVRTTLFRNATELARNVPAFLLRISLDGPFWLEIENALSSRGT